VVNHVPEKAVRIWSATGRRSLLAAGNSNGDLQMLAFTGGLSTPALHLLIVHDDAEREFEYIAGAEKVLSAAQTHGWTTVSTQREWRKIFPG
jgi:hypothetical protein